MMGAIWFWIVAVMVAAYVVLDGFDIGVGILYPFLARTEEDRLVMMRSIGPVWDGNEVWPLAADRARHEHRASHAHRQWRVAQLLRWPLLSLQRAACDLSRSRTRQCHPRRSHRSGPVLLPSLV